MKQHFRFRNYFLVGGTLLVMLALWYSDPNGGAITATLAAQLATPIIAVWFAHLARKALFDYIDLGELVTKAKESAVGAAIIFASVCAIVFALLGLFGNQVKAEAPRPSSVSTYIPKQAFQHLPTLKAEQTALWVSHPKQNSSEL